MTTIHTIIRNHSRAMFIRRLLVLLIALSLLSVNLHADNAAAGSSEPQSTIVLQTVGAPFLEGTTQIVGNQLGEQVHAHVSCNLVSYTNLDSPGSSTARYCDLVTGTDSVIPGNRVDPQSDISGSRVAYTEHDTAGDRLIVFDTISQTSTHVPGVRQSNPSIGGNLVAFEDQSSSVSWLMADISTYDLSTGTVTQLTNDSLSNVRPNVSPNGDAVVWQKCTNFGTDCGIYAALQTAPGVFTTKALTEADDSHSPSTNGEIAVYISRRTGDDDVFYQPLAGGTEVRLAIPGHQGWVRVSGDLISFESQDLSDFTFDLYVYDIRTGKLFQVTNTPGMETMSDIGVCNGIGRIVYTAPGDVSFDLYAFSFQVPSVPEDQIDDLISLIRNCTLPPGTTNSLITKLQQALDAIDSGDLATACSSLAAFTNECSAQSGKKLTIDQATELINLANQIKSDLGCP
jgi:Tol biopolymer transport system component